MTLLAELTVSALLLPIAITPPGMLAYVQPPEAVAPAPAPAPAVVVVAPTPPVAVAPAPVVSPTIVAPVGSTVVVTETVPTTSVPVATTGATTTTTTTTTTTVAPTLTPQVAVRNLLRYDPYLAPRYRSGRNMMIFGGVSLGVGTFTLLSTLSWLTLSREAVDDSADADERRRDARERAKWVPTARVVGIVAAAVAVGGVVLLATGAVRRRRAIEEARGRVYMQAGPGGMQVRF